MDAHGEIDLTPLQRWSEIVETAQQALVTEAMADAAEEDAAIDLWLDFDEQCACVLRLLTEAGAVPMRVLINRALVAEEPFGDVPQAWPDLLARFREAREAGALMKDQRLPQDMRDEATRAYCAATDAMVAQMARLSADHTLGRITLLLSGGVAR